MYRAVFMDIDGTMLDSNRAHARAWAIALAEKGYDVTAADVLPLVGMGSEKVLCKLTGLSDTSAAGKELAERSGAIFRERFLDEQRPFPRVRELLERWKEQGLVLGVATSGGSADADGLLRRAGVGDLFDCRVTFDDVDRSKPDPDILSVALEKCGMPPSDVVLVGDTPYDVQAAAAAGVDCIGVRCGGWSTSGLDGAIAVFDDPAQILAHLDEPPLAEWFPRRDER